MIKNESILKDIYSIKEEVSSSSLILEYLSLKKLVNSSYYKDKINKMNFYKNCPSMEKDNSEYLTLKKELDKDLILSNYESISYEVRDYLNEIKELIIKIR